MAISRRNKVLIGLGAAVLGMCGIVGCLAAVIDPPGPEVFNGPATPLVGPSPSRTTQIATQSATPVSKPKPSQVKLPTFVGEGFWVVGEDIEPGSYRVAEEVTQGNCYWFIYRSGTNQADIRQAEVVTGGMPRVKLLRGYDFKSQGCGSWVRVGN